jgi:hypothetical protein
MASRIASSNIPKQQSLKRLSWFTWKLESGAFSCLRDARKALFILFPSVFATLSLTSLFVR